MGFWGFGWLSDEVQKLEALKETLKDKEQIQAIDEIINDIKKKTEAK